MVHVTRMALASILAWVASASDSGRDRAGGVDYTGTSAVDGSPVSAPGTGEPGCPPWVFESAGAAVPIEHTDEVCDRAWENNVGRMDRIREQIQASVNSGVLRQLRDDMTWHCPTDESYEEGATPQDTREGGPPSVWIFRNEASTPVSVAWVNPDKNNLEVSAFDATIFPAHHDPKSVVRPGEWKALEVYLGHYFHVRELLPLGGQLAPGRLLVRHRPGPIPIKNRYGGPGLECPIPALVDPDPMKETADPKAPDPDAEARRIEENKVKYRRSPFRYDKRCHALHREFVNRMHCPVDVYYAGISPEVGAGAGAGKAAAGPPFPSIHSKGETSATTALDAKEPQTTGNADPFAIVTRPDMAPLSKNRENGCFERFKFHLGVNPGTAGFTGGEDYLEAWDSPVAYEATYLSHKFVARLRHDPDVVVDEMVIDRTYIRDCPNAKAKAGVAVGGEKVGILEGRSANAGDRDAGGEDIAGSVEVDAMGAVDHEIVVKGYDFAAAASRNDTAATSSEVPKNATRSGDDNDLAARQDEGMFPKATAYVIPMADGFVASEG